MSLSDVSRETAEQSFAQNSARRRSRSKVERNGKLVRIGPSWSEDEIATLRMLVAAGCLTADIATHFKTSPHAVSAVMHRQRILRRHPTVAEILGAKEIPGAGVAPLAGAVEMPVSQPIAAGGVSTLYPVVEIIDRFEKHVCEVELREIDERRQCRVVRRHGDHAGQWATFPLWQVRFYTGTDRRLAIDAARLRGQARADRRAARLAGEKQ